MFTSPFPDHPAEILSKKSKNKSYLSCNVWEWGNSHTVRFPASKRVKKYVNFPIPRSSGRDLVEEIKKQKLSLLLCLGMGKFAYREIPRVEASKEICLFPHSQIIRQRSCRRNQKTKVISLAMSGNGAVSYTHLTLPTKRIV